MSGRPGRVASGPTSPRGLVPSLQPKPNGEPAFREDVSRGNDRPPKVCRGSTSDSDDFAERRRRPQSLGTLSLPGEPKKAILRGRDGAEKTTLGVPSSRAGVEIEPARKSAHRLESRRGPSPD